MGTEHRNLTWTPMLLLLTGVICNQWKVEYGQRNICAIKGSSVVIPCSFYYPKKQEVQSVKWAHGRSHIYKGPFIYDSESNYTSSRYQYIGDTQHNCSFKIHQVERNDSGKHAFRFSTISNNDLQEWTGSVGSQLKVVDLKVSMTKTNGSETIKEGDSVSLKCRNGCDVGGLSSSFTWFKNGEPINDGPILNLSNISSTNSGNYSCSLTTQRGLPSGVINIDAEYGPKNTSVSVRPSAQIHIGSSVSLICSTNANPTAEHYTWFKRSHDDDVIVGNGPELNFREIQPHDGGQYLCSVINKHGRQNSSIVTIKVKAYWPTFTRDVLIIATVATLLIVTAVIAIRRLTKKRIRAPTLTPPDTDCVEDLQNAVYINWPVLENNQPQAENSCEGIRTELIYATVDFTTKTKSNMKPQMNSHDDEGVIYSTVCRDQISIPSCSEEL